MVIGSISQRMQQTIIMLSKNCNTIKCCVYVTWVFWEIQKDPELFSISTLPDQFPRRRSLFSDKIYNILDCFLSEISLRYL